MPEDRQREERSVAQVQRLYEAGEREQAFELLAELQSEASSPELDLLKAELCLKDQREPTHVAQVARRIWEEAAPSEREQAVVAGALDWAQQCLQRAADEMERSGEKALENIDRARLLAGWDARVQLASGLLLWEMYTADSPARIRRDSALLERHQITLRATLTAAREQTEPEQAIWQHATRTLLEVLLKTQEWEQLGMVLAEAERAGLARDEPLARAEQASARQALDDVLTIGQRLLETGAAPEAAVLLEKALVAAPDYARTWIAIADWLLAHDRGDDALEVYRWVVAASGETAFEHVLHPTAAHTLAREAVASQPPCTRCDFVLSFSSRRTCRHCGWTPDVELWSVTSGLADQPPVIVAAASLALLGEPVGREREVYDAAKRALEALPSRHSQREQLKALVADLELTVTQADYDDALQAVEAAYGRQDFAGAREALEQAAASKVRDDRVAAWEILLAAAEGRDITW